MIPPSPQCPDVSSTPRIAFCTHACYLDDSNGAAVASRAMMEALARRGFAVEVLSGTMLELRRDVEIGPWLRERGHRWEEHGGGSLSFDARGVRADEPVHFRLDVRGVPVTLHHGPTSGPHVPEDFERGEFLRLFDAVLDRFRPDVLVNYGGDVLAREVRERARRRGIAVVFALHNFNYRSAEPFAGADAVLVPSRFAADHYRATFGLDCAVLPYVVDLDRARATVRDPRYVTFVNPSAEKGVDVFARIADELGRRRPEVPLLVVEGRGTEETLAACGLDLRGCLETCAT